MKVKLENLTKRWGPVYAARDINLDINDGEFVAFLGPSGCGKTTTLLLIAGIYKPTAGRILFDDRVMNQVPPKNRNIGMVFQSYALYPHMTVYENLVFPMKLKRVPPAEMKARAQRVAEMLGISQLLDRRPGQLSGGQQQRVALGRALTKQPDLLLFDEPLSNLDARLRLSMRAEIKRLQMDLGVTAIYVTHDQVEAMTMGTRIAVMKDGVLQQIDTPQALYDRPDNVFVAGFIGSPSMNFFDATLTGSGGDVYVDTGAFRVKVPENKVEPYRAHLGKQVIFGIRPEDVHDPEYAPPGIHQAIVESKVDVTELMGNEVIVYLMTTNNKPFLARVDPRTKARVGSTMGMAFNLDNMHIFDKQTEKAVR